MIGLKPWEYYSLSPIDYDLMVEGYQLKNEIALDSVRWLATIIAKVGGAKKIRKPTDLMKLPLIDSKDTIRKTAGMIEYLKAQRAGGGDTAGL